MSLVSRIVRRVAAEAGLYLPVRYSCPVDNLTVSLTSFPARLPLLHQVVRSLLHQTMQPARIVLYLGTDTPDSAIPEKLRKLQKYNFIIKTGYEDLKPHKKYYYAMSEYPQDVVITVDDDLLYDRNLICDLYNSYVSHPDCVSARRVHKMRADGTTHTVAPYDDWEWECKSIAAPSFSLLATGCGGVLYPSGILPAETFDVDLIKKSCLRTDDIWLKFMELKNNVKVVWTGSNVIHPLSVRGTQKTSLMAANTSSGNGNDVAINTLQQLTGINIADYVEG